MTVARGQLRARVPCAHERRVHTRAIGPAPTSAAALVALRLMAFIAITFGRRVARLVLHPIVWYFLLFARGSRRQSARYLGRALGRPARWSDVYRHLHCFASTVLDRVYLVRGRCATSN